MILRRVIVHVRTQNWFAVAIDFVIVVVGVFIGIQVANWNDARADRALGRDYVRRLQTDLQRDLVSAQNLAAYFRAVRESIIATEALLSDAGADPRAFVVAAYRASEIANIPSSRSTWDQIVSSGHLGLLPQGALDAGLSEYFAFSQSNDSAENFHQSSAYRHVVRSLIPIAVQLAIREGCSDVTDDINVITGFAVECRLAVAPEIIEETAARLRADPALLNELRHQYSLVIVVSNTHDGNVVLLQRILDVLRRSEPR